MLLGFELNISLYLIHQIVLTFTKYFLNKRNWLIATDPILRLSPVSERVYKINSLGKALN